MKNKKGFDIDLVHEAVTLHKDIESSGEELNTLRKRMNTEEAGVYLKCVGDQS